MKQLLHHIVFCCLTVLCFAACDKDDTFHAAGSGGDGNSIILDLASASLPVTRATVEATGVEIAVSHLDVLIFNEEGTKVWHERVSTADKSKTITLSAKRSSFTANEKYWVYLIANSTADVNTFKADDFDLAALKAMKQEDERIHITGLSGIAGGAPQTFLMDGIAYPKGTKEPETAGTVELNNGKEADNTELQVTLRRAAAKIVVSIKKGEQVEFDNSPAAHRAGYYLRNMPYNTSVIPPESMDAATAKLRTPDLFKGSYFNWTDRVITVTAYTYAHVWEDASTLEKEVRLIVNIPMTYTPQDEEGKPGDSQYLANSYYQIPVSQNKTLKRNTCYQVTVTVNAPGGSDPSKPVELNNISYSVYDWEEEQINVGGEDERPAYLTLNEYEMEMHNMADDNTTLEFASSSEVTAEITRVYYIDKFGQEKTLEKTNNRDNPDEWGERINSYPYWKNECTIRITPDKNISGKIDVFSTVPENNAVRYIEFTVTNKEGIKRQVKVAQYPLEYITNVQGWYSYRSDFNTSWELLNGINVPNGSYDAGRTRISDRYVSAHNWNSNRKNWEYSNNNDNDSSFDFRSKVVTSTDEQGQSNIYYYRWKESSSGFINKSYTYTREANHNNGSSSLNNARMYHVTITASSGEYTLGKPRITNGKTDSGADNAELVSPSFMIASQLGAVRSNGFTSAEMAASHCEQYVEVAEDGTKYDDWRLPTQAEVNIIMKFQKLEDAIDKVLTGDYYWAANGIIQTSTGNLTTRSSASLRCIRDAYDKKTGK